MRIIIQKIVTHWTKKSRGGLAAAQRNATPKVLPLPLLPATTNDVITHVVTFDEGAQFEPATAVEMTNISGTNHFVEGLGLHFEGNKLRVMYVWSHNCGAPNRPDGRALRIPSGAWCQLLHNGRYGYDRGWSYQTTVLNVALYPFDSRGFLDKAPAEVSDHRAKLW